MRVALRVLKYLNWPKTLYGKQKQKQKNMYITHGN